MDFFGTPWGQVILGLGLAVVLFLLYLRGMRKQEEGEKRGRGNKTGQLTLQGFSAALALTVTVLGALVFALILTIPAYTEAFFTWFGTHKFLALFGLVSVMLALKLARWLKWR